MSKKAGSLPRTQGYSLMRNICVILIPAVAVLLLGIYSSSDGALGPNRCKMTYTSRSKRLIAVKSDSLIDGPKLYKYTNHNTKILNEQPVLFIPGHKGMVDQVRSFSSTEHNGDAFFQYFSLDFQEASSAFHGSDILTQAVFVNDALRAIQDLYRAAGDDVPQIMILAHSLGGMVARASVLLSNYPRRHGAKGGAGAGGNNEGDQGCGVSDIIMLSTPNNRAPYSADASMDALYTSVNRAWAGALYSTSQQCRQSVIKHWTTLTDPVKSKSTVTANWVCPPCAARIRLISITGGALDELVSPSLTRLDNLAPVPRNITQERIPPPSMLSMLSPFLSGPMYVLSGGARAAISIGSAYFSKANSSTNSSSSSLKDAVEKLDHTVDTIDAITPQSSSVTDVDEECAGSGTCPALSNIEIPEQVAAAAAAAAAAAVGPVAVKGQAVHRITEQDWTHMQDYMDPLHLSVHTTQLPEVGFPIDHKAVLWCFQLVSSVTSSMTQLSYANKDEAKGRIVDLREIFLGVHGKEDENDELDILPVQALAARNASSVQWKAALLQDRSHLLNRSPWGPVQTLAFEFYTSHLFKIFACYMMLCFLSLSYPIFAALTNSSSDASSWSLLHPWTHSHLRIISPALDSAVKSILPSNMAHLVTPHRPILFYLMTLVLALVIPKMLFDFIFRPLQFLVLHSPVFYWFTSYGLALGLRVIVLVTLVCVRWVSSTVWYALKVLLRATIWCQFIRRRVRSAAKAVKKMILKRGYAPYLVRGDFLGLCFLMCVGCALLVMGVRYSSDRVFGSDSILGMGTLFVCLSSLALTLVSVILLLVTITQSPSVSEDKMNAHGRVTKYDHSTHIASLLLPLPLLCYPTAYFSFSLLFRPQRMFLAALPLFDIFGPERLTFCVCLFTIAVHLISVQLTSDTIGKVGPVAWMVELFGPSEGDVGFADDYFANAVNSLSSRGDGRRAGGCVHEDGGRYAVFQSTEGDAAFSVSKVSPGVFRGPLFKVVSCACARDKQLKDSSEWCEFCICRKCGGKNLPKESKTTRSSVNSDGIAYPDSSPELLLLAGLLACALGVMFYAGDRPYRHLYLMGVACTLYCFTDACNFFSTLFP